MSSDFDIALAEDDTCAEDSDTCALQALQRRTMSSQRDVDKATEQDHQEQDPNQAQVMAGLCQQMPWLPVCQGSHQSNHQPSYHPNYQPSHHPSYQPSYHPNYQPSYHQPSYHPSYQPSYHPPAPSYHAPAPSYHPPAPSYQGGGGQPSSGPSMIPGPRSYNYYNKNGLLEEGGESSKELLEAEQETKQSPCVYMPWLPICGPNSNYNPSNNNWIPGFGYAPRRRYNSPPRRRRRYSGASGGAAGGITYPGTMTLYHETSPDIANKILASNFRPGHSGWCGGAIYFFGSPNIPNSKLGPDSHGGAIIEVTVNMGRMAHLNSKCGGAQNGFKNNQWDSVTFNPGDGNEYIIEDASRITSKKRYK